MTVQMSVAQVGKISPWQWTNLVLIFNSNEGGERKTFQDVSGSGTLAKFPQHPLTLIHFCLCYIINMLNS